MGCFCNGQSDPGRQLKPCSIRRCWNGRCVRRHGARANRDIDYGIRDDRWLRSDRAVDARDNHRVCRGTNRIGGI